MADEIKRIEIVVEDEVQNAFRTTGTHFQSDTENMQKNWQH